MGKFGNWLAPAGCLVVGAVLVGLAAPRLASAVAALPGEAAAFALKYDQPVSAKALERMIDARQAGLAVLDNAEYRRQVGGAMLLLAARAPAGPERERHLDAAAAATRAALASAPVDPFSWARLAQIELMRPEPDLDAAADALRTSMLTGAYDPNLTEWRLGMALRLWPSLDVEDRQRYAGHVPLLWRDDPQGLLRLSMEPDAFAIVTAILDDPAALDKLASMRRNRLRQQKDA